MSKLSDTAAEHFRDAGGSDECKKPVPLPPVNSRGHGQHEELCNQGGEKHVKRSFSSGSYFLTKNTVYNFEDVIQRLERRLQKLQPSAISLYGPDLLIADSGESSIKLLRSIDQEKSALAMPFQADGKWQVNGKVSGFTCVDAKISLFNDQPATVATRKLFIVAALDIHSLIVIDSEQQDPMRRFRLPTELVPHGKHKCYLLHQHSEHAKATLRASDKLWIAFRGSKKLVCIDFEQLFQSSPKGNELHDVKSLRVVDFIIHSAAYSVVHNLLIVMTTDKLASDPEAAKHAKLRALSTDNKSIESVAEFLATDCRSEKFSLGECCAADNGLVFVSNQCEVGVFSLLPGEKSGRFEFSLVNCIDKCPNLVSLAVRTVSLHFSDDEKARTDNLELVTLDNTNNLRYLRLNVTCDHLC